MLGSTTWALWSWPSSVFNVEGDIHAVENTCTRGLVLDRATVANGEVLCPWHGWRFDLETGCCALMPDHRTRVFPVRVEEGDVFVELLDARDDLTVTEVTATTPLPSVGV